MAEKNPCDMKLDKLFKLVFYKNKDQWKFSSKETQDLDTNLSDVNSKPKPKPKKHRHMSKYGDSKPEKGFQKRQKPQVPASEATAGSVKADNVETADQASATEAKDKPLQSEELSEATGLDYPHEYHTDTKDSALMTVGSSMGSVNEDKPNSLVTQVEVDNVRSQNRVTNRIKLLLELAVTNKSADSDINWDSIPLHSQEIYDNDNMDQANEGMLCDGSQAAFQSESPQLAETYQDSQEVFRSDEELEYYGTPSMRWQLMYSLACSEIKDLGFQEPSPQAQMMAMPNHHSSSSDDSFMCFLENAHYVPHSSEKEVEYDSPGELDEKRLAMLSLRELSAGMAKHVDALQKLMQESNLRAKKMKAGVQKAPPGSANEILLGSSTFNVAAPGRGRRPSSIEADEGPSPGTSTFFPLFAAGKGRGRLHKPNFN